MSKWSTGALFLAVWAGVLVLAAMVVMVGSMVAGSPEGFKAWLDQATPWFMVWRLLAYGVGGFVYIRHFRPRLRAMQQTQRDGGTASHARLRKAERLVLLVVVVIELTNLPSLIQWFHG